MTEAKKIVAALMKPGRIMYIYNVQHNEIEFLKLRGNDNNRLTFREMVQIGIYNFPREGEGDRKNRLPKEKKHSEENIYVIR